MTRQSLTNSRIDSMIDSMQQYSLLIWSAARIESDARCKLSAFRGIISCPLSSWHSVQNRNYKSEKILLPQEKTLSRQAGRQADRQTGRLLDKTQANNHIKRGHVPLHTWYTTCVIAVCWFQQEMLCSACFACLHFHPRWRLPCTNSAHSTNINNHWKA